MESTNKIIFLIDRDNWQKDDALSFYLVHYLKKTKHEIRWEDPAGSLLYKLRSFENRFKWLPNYIKKLDLHVFLIFYGVFHWNYFKYLYDRKSSSVEFRAKCLKKHIQKLGNLKEIIILSRSSGGRFSSLIADDLKIKHLICLSYPFKHPSEALDISRYMHLKELRTPMLIIQGDKDEYGGLEVKKKYSLSSQIELFFVNANHDFNISKEDWIRVLTKLNEIVN